MSTRRRIWYVGIGFMVVAIAAATVASIRYGIDAVAVVLAPIVSMTSPVVTVWVASELRRTEPK